MKIRTSYTKWYPLYTYESRGDYFMTQCRQNIETGYLYFATTKINKDVWRNIDLGLNPLEQFKKIQEEGK